MNALKQFLITVEHQKLSVRFETFLDCGSVFNELKSAGASDLKGAAI